MSEPELWRCPACGQTFVSRNMPHSCQVVPLESHFAAVPELRPVFEAYVAAAAANGPVTVNATKSRVTIQARMRFAGIDRPRRDHLRANFILTRPLGSPRIAAVEFIAPYYYVHRLRLYRPEDVDDELHTWLAEAYRVGEQRHVRRSRGRAAAPGPDR